MRAALMVLLMAGGCGASASDACRDLGQRICEAFAECGEDCPTLGGQGCEIYDELSCDWTPFFECQDLYCAADGVRDRHEDGACLVELGEDPNACILELSSSP